VLLLTKVFNELGPDGLETDAIADKIEAYPGPAFLGDPTLKFGTEPFPTVGTLRVQYIEHHEDGTWTQAAGGKWFGPPPPADPGA
jgi:hypothetical protein